MGVHVTASVAQVAVPDGVTAPSGRVELIAGVGRRILLSVEASPTVPRIRLLENSLAIFTYGGTLAGWARVARPAGASARESLQVSGGFLRIAPFVPGATLRAYTQTIDVLVVPGAVPVSGLALHPGRMWDDAGQPILPRELKIALDPIQHMTQFDVVDATSRFEFKGLYRHGVHAPWECSVESHFQLLDHDSALPKLWVLQRVDRTGSTHGTVALYNPRVGAFAAVFRDPATAAGFARWLSETRATRVGEYDIGLTALQKATGFSSAQNDEPADLMVEQLGKH